jgi:hypothetical protein
LSVERKLHHLVRGGNADEGELARPVKRYRGRARHSYNLCRIAKLAIGGDRQHGHTSVAAIGDQKIPRLPIERQVTGPGAHRRALVDQRQLSGRSDRKRAHRSGRLSFELINFIDGKQQSTFEVELEKRRVGCFGGQPKRDERHVLKDLVARRLQSE